MSVDKNGHFLTPSPPHLVHVVTECPLTACKSFPIFLFLQTTQLRSYYTSFGNALKKCPGYDQKPVWCGCGSCADFLYSAGLVSVAVQEVDLGYIFFSIKLTNSFNSDLCPKSNKCLIFFNGFGFQLWFDPLKRVNSISFKTFKVRWNSCKCKL